MRRSGRKGFTTLELLVVVGLVSVLSALSMVAVVRYQKDLSLKEMDETAKEIFLAAQEHLAVAGSQRRLDGGSAFELLRLSAGSASAAVVGTPLSADPEESEYVVFVEDGTVLDGGALDTLLPRAAIDAYATGHSFVIHYDKATYRVLDVFYTTDRDLDLAAAFRDYYAPDTSDPDPKTWKDLTDLAEDRNNRSDLLGQGIVGFYEDVDVQVPSPRPDRSGEIALEVVDGPILYAVVTVEKDQISGNDLDLILTHGTDTHTTPVFTNGICANDRAWKLRERSTMVGSKDTTVVDYVVILDDITSPGFDFASMVKDDANRIPAGALIEVKAELKEGGTVRASTQYEREKDGRKTKTVSSLFSEDSASATDVQITNFRHLQNLDQNKYAHDDLLSGEALKATLGESMYWNTYQTKVAAQRGELDPPAAGTHLTRKDTNVPYAPPTIDYELTFDGAGKSINGLTYTDTDPGSSAPAGVFGEIRKTTSVEDLTVQNVSIQGWGDTGALAGTVTGSLTVRDVTVRDGQIWSDTGAAGGLIGGVIGAASDTVTIEDVTISGAIQATASGGAAGGVIGSYSGAGGLTFTDAPSVNGTVKATASGGAAGGVIGRSSGTGTLTGLSISGSVSVYGDTAAGGLIGEAAAPVTLSDPPAASAGTASASGGAGGAARSRRAASAAGTVNVSVDTVGATAASGAAGGAIGKADAAVQTGDVTVTVDKIEAVSGGAGGVIGAASGTVTLADVTVTVNGTTASIQGDTSAGGVVGTADEAVQTGDVTVTVDKIEASGGAAGGVIGAASGTVTLADVTVNGTTASIQGGTSAGGVVGTADEAVQTGDVTVTVNKIEASGGGAGGVIGSASDTVTLADVTVNGTTASIQGGTSAGGVIGAYSGTGPFTFADALSVSGTVRATAPNGAAGGLIGTYDDPRTASGLMIVRSGTASGPMTVSGVTVEAAASGGMAGGVIGRYDGMGTISGLRIDGVKVTASGGTAGGAFGTIEGAAGIGTASGTDDDTIEILDASVSGGSYAGGLAGSVTGTGTGTGVRIEGVLVYHRADTTDPGTYAHDHMVTASGTAGGLIGSVSGGTVTGCAASVLVEAAGTGGVAGGLIGSVSVSGTTTISGSYVGGHTDPSTDPDDPTRVRYPATENVTAGTGGTAGGFLGSVTGSGTVTIGTCYTTATADGGFIGGIGSTAAVTATGATYDATASKLSAANTSISGLKAGSAYMSDHDARPYDGKLHGVSDPFQAVDDDPDAYWFLRTHVGDWWPEAAAAYHTVTWKTPTGFARGVSATAYDTYTTLSDGSVQVHQDLVQDGDSVGLPTVDMTAFPLRLDYQIDHWTWFDLDEDPATGAVTAHTDQQYLVRSDGVSYFARAWEEDVSKWQSWSSRTAADLGVSSPASVTKDLILYAHARKDPTVVELRGYKMTWDADEGEYAADTTKIPAYIEYPDQVTDPVSGKKTVTFRTPTLGGYEIETRIRAHDDDTGTDTYTAGGTIGDAGTVTWWYRDASGAEQDLKVDGDAVRYDAGTWTIVVPEDVDHLYAYYAPVVERTVTVEFLSTGGSPIHTPAVYAFAKAGETLTIDLPADGRMPDYTPQSYTDADGASADLTADTKQIAIRSGDGPTVWKVYYQNTAYHDVKIVHEIQSVADSVTADSILTQIPNYYADASTKVTIGTPAPGTTDLTVTETTERGTGEALSSTLDGLTAKHMETFRLTIANYTSTMPRLSAETAEDGVTVTGYVVTITYVRQPVTLYYDLNGGTYDHDGISEIGISNSRGKPGDASDSYAKTHDDAGDSLIKRTGYTAVGWRLVTRSDYDAATKAQLEDWRTYDSAADTTTGTDPVLTAYSKNVPLPAEDSVAVLIWDPTAKTADVTVRIFLQKKTDEPGISNDKKNYDFLRSKTYPGITVGDWYGKQSATFGQRVLDDNYTGYEILGEMYRMGDSAGNSSKGFTQHSSSGKNKDQVFFNLNRENSDTNTTIVPGKNVIDLRYDRATVKFVFNNLLIASETPAQLISADDLYIKHTDTVTYEKWTYKRETTDLSTVGTTTNNIAESGLPSGAVQGTGTTSGSNKTYNSSTYTYQKVYYLTEDTESAPGRVYYKYKRQNYTTIRYWWKTRTYEWPTQDTAPSGTPGTVEASDYPVGWNWSSTTDLAGYAPTGDTVTGEDGTVWYKFSKTELKDTYTAYAGTLDDKLVVNWWTYDEDKGGYRTAGSIDTDTKFGALVDGTLTELVLYQGGTATVPTMADYEWQDGGFYKKRKTTYKQETKSNSFSKEGLYQSDLNFDWPTENYVTINSVKTSLFTGYYYDDHWDRSTLDKTTGTFTLKFNYMSSSVSTYIYYYLEKDGGTARTAEETPTDGITDIDGWKTKYFGTPEDTKIKNVGNQSIDIDRYIPYTQTERYKGNSTSTTKEISTATGSHYYSYNERRPFRISYEDASPKGGGDAEDLTKLYLYKEWVRKLPGADEIQYSDPSYTFLGWSEDGKTLVTDENGYFLRTFADGIYIDDGQVRYYYSMPANFKTFIALWWSPIRVDLVYKDDGMEDGKYKHVDTDFRTVDKYSSMTEADHTAADDGIKGLNWYFDAACTIPFDFTKDPVINNGTDPATGEAVMTLYGTTASGEEITIPVYYRFGDDYISPDGSLSHSAVPYETIRAVVDGSYAAEADPILTLTADGVEHIYQLADDQESVLSGEVSDKTKDGLATDGVTFRYVEYADTEWSYVVVTDLRIGSGDETVLLRTGSETVSGQTERRVVVPAEDRQGLKLRSDSYQVVDRPAGDGTAVVEVVYEPDLHNIRFSGGTASAADLPRAYAWFSSEGVLVPLCGYFHLIPGIDWTDADGAVWVLGADYTYTPASGGGASTISEIYGVEDDGTTQKVTTIASADIPSGAYSVTADVWAAKRSGDSVSGKVTIKSMTADLTVE